MEFLQAFDEGALFWCENHHTTIGNAVMEFATRLGNPEFVIGVIALGGILFALARRRRTAVILLFISLLSLAINMSVSFLLKRDRPDVRWRLIDRPHTPSFPSAHAQLSMTVYGGMALMAARRLRRRRVLVSVLVAGFTLPLIIGLSRPYVGVHWPTDVFAGWTAGLACALLALWTDQIWSNRTRMNTDATDFHRSER